MAYSLWPAWLKGGLTGNLILYVTEKVGLEIEGITGAVKGMLLFFDEKGGNMTFSFLDDEYWLIGGLMQAEEDQRDSGSVCTIKKSYGGFSWKNGIGSK